MKMVKPINNSVKAKGHTPQYRMHKYFARRPYNVFSNLISHYSEKNEIILDCFCGGGVTVFEGAALERKMVGVDLNPLATFITRMQMFNGDIEYLKKIYKEFNDLIKKKYEKWYAINLKNDYGICIWTEWAYIILCPHCGQKIILSEENKIRNGVYQCKDKNCEGYDGVRRIDGIPNGSTPIRVKYRSAITHDIKTEKLDSNNIINTNNDFLKNLNHIEYKPNFKIPLNWDRQAEDKLKEKGVAEYKDLFTERNYAINCLIFNDILSMKTELPKETYEMLYFLFSSSLRYTNNMTRVTDNWEGGNPTSMDKHAYWLPNQYVETNIVDVISKRTKNILSGAKYSKKNLPKTCNEVFSFKELQEKGGYFILNRSSSNLPVAENSVDVIITDPPYGSNVQYAELSAVWNTWYEAFSNLNTYIFKEEEAIINRKQKIEGAKTETDYEEQLYNIFVECYRVLKNEGYLIFTFNNKNIKVWIAMLKAVARAGFYLPENGVLFQDFIKSYKNTSHLKYSGNIHGDYIYSFQKTKKKNVEITFDDDLKKVITNSIEIEIEKLFGKNHEEKVESIGAQQKLFEANNVIYYTNTQLYEHIFSKLAELLMSFIVKNLNYDIDQLIKIEKFSNNYIDQLLKRHLKHTEKGWSLRK